MDLKTTMNLRALRKRCEARVREMVLPVPFDAYAFCRMLASQRGRPILLRPMEMGRGRKACGLWLATDAADFILYVRATTYLHQQHIILHEAAHILCDHQPAQGVAAGRSTALFPELDMERLQVVMQRSAYLADEEQEAEMIATLLLKRIATAIPAAGFALPSATPADPAAAALVKRLTSSLADEGGDNGWDAATEGVMVAL